MKRIAYATTNQGKFHSMREPALEYEIEVIHWRVDLPEIQSLSSQEIARWKMNHAAGRTDRPICKSDRGSQEEIIGTDVDGIICLDGGCYIKDRGGFPGPLTKLNLQQLGLTGMFLLLQGTDRKCYFEDCLTYWNPELTEPLFFTTQTFGQLIEVPLGELDERAWSSLHTIFVPDGQNKTLAQMTKEERKTWSRERDAQGQTYRSQFFQWLASH